MYYFIVNKHGGSGNARKTWHEVRHLMKEKGIEYKAYATSYVGHGAELASKVCALPDDDIRLIVVGGDGTINEVLNGITDFDKIKLGVIPTGSGNDFARELEIPRDTGEALDLVLSSIGEKRIDLGRVWADNGSDRIFGISSGIGLDAIVCKKVQNSVQKKLLNKLHLGSLSYILTTIKTLFVMKKYDVNVRVYKENKPEVPDIIENYAVDYCDLIFLAGMNFKCEGGGVPMTPGAKPDDGLLSVCAVNGVPKWKAFFKLTKLMKGTHKGSRGFNLYDAEKLELRAAEPMVLHADGEYLGDVKLITMEVLPKKLRVLI